MTSETQHRIGGCRVEPRCLIAAACFVLAAAFAHPAEVTHATEIPDSAGEELYLLDIEADGYLLAEAVPAYRSGSRYLIEINELLAAVEFPIAYDGERFAGWFRSEDREFLWRPDSGELRIDGVVGVAPETVAWQRRADGFFVALDVVGGWFGLYLDVDSRRQVVTVRSAELLPFQEWQRRMLAKYRHRGGADLEPDVVVPDQYRWATMPLFNLSTHLLTRRQNGMGSHAATASTIMSMDLLKHSVTYSGSVSHRNFDAESGLDTTRRLTVERAASTADGTLFAGSNHYMFGDVYHSASNLVLSGGSGRGFSLRRSADPYSSMNRVTILGDAPPGWQVELYRNGMLMEFGSVGRDGRYLFADQPLAFGENVFVARLFGPQGQVREDRQVRWGGGVELDRGDYDYSVSFVDYGRNFVDVAPDNANALPARSALEMRASRAWTDDIQAGVGYTRAGLGNRLRDGAYVDTDYLSLFGRSKVGPGILVAEAVRQLDAGQAWSLEYLTGRNGHSLGLAHRVYGDFDSPATIHGDDLDAVSELSLTGPLGFLRDTSYLLRVAQRDKADGSSDLRMFNRLGTRFGRLSVGNDIEHIASAGPDSTRGQLRVAGRVGRFSMRGHLDYQLSGGQLLRQISTTVNWDYSSRLTNNFVVTQNFSDDSVLFSNLLSLRVRNFDLTFSTSADLEGSWQVGVGLDIAFGYDGHRRGFVTDRWDLASTGRAAMNLFIDHNNNGRRDPGEPPVSWARYREEEMSATTPGTVPLRALPRYRTVTIDTSDLRFDDPFLLPRSELYEIYTHAGSEISVDVAVVMTGDIEGYVYTGSPGSAVPARGVEVTLLDAAGNAVASARSEFDGFYSFTSMPAGDYRVRIAEAESRELTQPFTLDGEQGFIVLDRIYL